MSLEINLLTQREGLSPSFLKFVRTLKKVSVVLLVLFILATIGVYSLGIFLNSQTVEVQNRITSTKKLIEEAKATESVYLAYTQKVQAIDEFIRQRLYPADYFKEIKQVLPSDCSIFTFSLDPQTISFSLKFSSLESLDEIIFGLQTKLAIPVSEIVMSGLEKSEAGYQANFQISFNPEG